MPDAMEKPAQPARQWPNGLDNMDEALAIMIKKLQFTHITTVKQLGEMRSQTLANKLDKYRNQLTPRNAATIFTLWVWECSRTRRRDYQSIVEPYCTCLQSFGYEEESILSMWDACSYDELGITVDGPLPAPLHRQNILEIRTYIRDHYLHKQLEKESRKNKKKTKGSTRELVSTNSYQSEPAKSYVKENLPLTPFQTARKHSEVASPLRCRSTSNSAVLSRSTSKKPPPPSLPPQKPPSPLTPTSAGHISDLFSKPRETHLLGFIDGSEIFEPESTHKHSHSEPTRKAEEKDMRPKSGYICRKCNLSGR